MTLYRRPGKDQKETAAERHNKSRQVKYHTNEAYNEKVRDAARATYRKENPIAPSKLRNGLLAEGTLREVYTESMDHPVVAETFTLPEAAKALGRAELTFKRWIYDGLIPDPILKETMRGHKLYSVGELQVIARILAEHERDYSYFTSKHEETSNRIWQMVTGFRATSI